MTQQYDTDLDDTLDTSVYTFRILHPQHGLQCFHLEKRWRAWYRPRYLVGRQGETPKEFKKLSDALAELAIQMIGEVQPRSEEHCWWTQGEDKAQRDAVIRAAMLESDEADEELVNALAAFKDQEGA